MGWDGLSWPWIEYGHSTFLVKGAVMTDLGEGDKGFGKERYWV